MGTKMKGWAKIELTRRRYGYLPHLVFLLGRIDSNAGRHEPLMNF